MKTIDWYFDYVSAFAYFQLQQFHQLPDDVAVRCKPVLFAGLLKNWATKGPAEVPSKRCFTYRHWQWLAKQHSIPFKIPPAHPFNPLKALRLSLALDSQIEIIQAIFSFIWRDGRSIDDADAWHGLNSELGFYPPTRHNIHIYGI